MRILLKKNAAFFLICFSGFYLTKVMSISPIYYAMFLSLFFISIGFVLGEKFTFRVEKITIPVILYILYLLITQFFLTENFSVLINVVMGLFYFLLTIFCLKGLSKDQQLKIIYYFLILSIGLLIVECVWRLSHPMFIDPNNPKFNVFKKPELLIYAYKFRSIMYVDSNFVGVFVLCLYFLCSYLNKKRKYIKYLKIILFILAVLSLSRAVIVTIIFYELLFLLIKKYGVLRVIIFFSVFILGFLISVLYYFKDDASFMTKFNIISITFDYLEKADLKNILLGVGMANAKDYLNIGSHNLFVTIFLDSGLLGFIFYLLMLIQIVIKTNYKALYVVLPFILAGMSFSPHAVPYFYCILGFIYTFEKKS